MAKAPLSPSASLPARALAALALLAMFNDGQPHPRLLKRKQQVKIFGGVIPKKRWLAAVEAAKALEGKFVARLQVFAAKPVKAKAKPAKAKAPKGDAPTA